jgi:hypothetical protein
MPAFLASTTCEIYRNANAPPAAPDVPLIPCQLVAQYGRGVEQGETLAIGLRVSHVMYIAATVDIRDAYNAGLIVPNTLDHVWIPDRNGTKFDVIFVERHLKGTAGDSKKVYLVRQSVTWPSDNL